MMIKTIFIFILTILGANDIFAANINRNNGSKLSMVSASGKQLPQDTQGLLKSYLKLSSFKHKVLSQNLANLNTPGYKADEVEMPQTIEQLSNETVGHKRVSLRRTSARHLAGTSSSNGKYAAQKLKDPYEIKPNGNNVSMPQQITKISQNQTNYDIALQAYKSTNSIINAALGKQ